HDVGGLDAFDLDAHPPGTRACLLEREGGDAVGARGWGTTPPHHAARGNTDAGAHGAAAARAPEAAHADGDAHRAAPASASAGRGVLDGLGVHEGAVGLHDLRALETTPPRVDLHTETIAHDGVGGGDRSTRHGGL